MVKAVNLVWLDNGRKLRSKEDILLWSRMSDVDEHSSHRVSLIQRIVHMAATVLDVSFIFIFFLLKLRITRHHDEVAVLVLLRAGDLHDVYACTSLKLTAVAAAAVTHIHIHSSFVSRPYFLQSFQLTPVRWTKTVGIIEKGSPEVLSLPVPMDTMLSDGRV